MPARNVFEYATLRVVPRVEREEFLNAGVVVMCRARRFLEACIELDMGRLLALAPDLDTAEISQQLEYLQRVCKGGPTAGPIGGLALFERFRWVTAPRSTIVQTSPVHTGVCDDPGLVVERLMNVMVRLPRTESLRCVDASGSNNKQ
jgi:hypothetical protein